MTNEQPQENNTQLPALLHPNKLLKGEREQRELAETLGRIGLILNATLDLSELIDIVCQESSQLFAVEAAYLGLVKDETLMRFAGPELSHQAFIQQRIPLDDPLTLGARVVRHKKPILINNAAHSPEVNPQLTHQFNLKAILGIPLLKGDEAIGVLVLLETVNPARFSQKDIELGLAFSSYAAIALQNACLFQATRRRAQQLTIINELSRDMGRVLEVKSLCEMVAQRVCVTLQYPHVDIFIVDPLTNQLVLQAIAGLYADKMQVGVYRQDYQAGLMGQTLRSGQTIFSNDTRLHPELIQLEGTTIGSEMVIPLIIREQAIGVLNISSDQFQAFDKDDVAVLTTVADQLAIAIDKSILFGETHRWAERLTSLQQVSQDLTALPDLQTLLHQIIKRALHLLGGQGGGIYLYRPESELLEHVVAIGHSPNNRLGVTVRAGEGMAGQVWLSGKPLLIEDYQTWVGKLPFWSEYPVTTLSVPIQGRAEFLGVLSIFADNSQHHYTPDDITLLAQFATQAAIAIQNVRLLEAERTARKQAEILREEMRQGLSQTTRLYELSTEFVSTLSVAETAHLVVNKIIQATQAHSAVVNLLDEAGNLILTTAPTEPPPRPNGTTMTIFKKGEPIAVSDASHEPDLMHPRLVATGLRAFIGLPLKAGNQISGVLFVRHAQPRQFSWREIETLFIFANQAAVAIQNARLYEQVQRYASELETQVNERTFALQVLLELAQALGQATHLRDIIRLILLHLYQVIPYDVAASLLVGEDLPGPLVIQSPRTLAPALETHLQELMSSALERFRGEASDSLTVEVRRIQAKPSPLPQPPLDKLASVMQALIFIEEKPVGILLIAAEKPQQFNTEHANLLRTVADQAAESIRRLRSLMAAEHRRLGSLVAHLPDGVILLDSEDRLVLANQMARQLLQSWSWREGDDKLTHLAGQPLAKFLTANVSGLPYEVELVAPVPRVFEIMVKAMGVGPEAGGWMLVIRDVTEERVTRERIRQQEQMAAIGQLAAGIAHDFNNILTSIIGFSELLLVEPDIPPPAKQDLERITKQGRRAAHLVSQILDFSRQSVIEKRPVNLVVFLQETLKLLERTISEAIQISLEIETTAHSYLLEADITQLQQAITNLAINARDAMPGGGQLRFRLRTLTLGPHDRRPTPDISMGTWLVLAVADTGLGIPPQIMPRIFEPFFTTKEVGQGTGLGLAQVYGIVKQHGGDIEVRSQTGQGTTFTLYLPAALTQNYSLPLAPPEATNIPYGQGELILLVEDDGAVLEAAQAMLERLRYRVLTASDGQAALKIYEHYQESIDLVLADLTMPNMGGLDLSIALRARNPALKILTMTGYPSPGETQELLSQGFTERLRKPLSIERLARMVHHLLYP